ncbi:ribonuclease H-like domain-containing protein [Tanacetum coccineum]|uniref:Ribonuclease H-like domain-containing protein n=1 Tax=Tanacetum coccineum TaxID=301880 RepID=A0ABQ5AZA8_9ASTR
MGKVVTGLNVQQGNLGDVFSSLGGPMIEKVFASGNKDTQEGNVGRSNVPNGADYEVWLPLASVQEVNYCIKNSLYGYFIGKRLAFPVVECGPRMLCRISIFFNKWSPFMSLLKEELSNVPVWVKFHDVLLVAYKSDGLSFMAMKTGTPLMLDSYMNSMCLESWEICYTKETIRIEYEWDPPRCSTCLIFSHSPTNCLKVAPIRVVNQKDKGKGQTSGADDEGFIEVKKMGRKPLEKVHYPVNLDSNDEVEPVENEMASFLASKSMSVGYGPKILLEQWRESNVDDDYDPYDDDMYEGHEIPDNIQTIYDNLDMKACGWKK